MPRDITRERLLAGKFNDSLFFSAHDEYPEVYFEFYLFKNLDLQKMSINKLYSGRIFSSYRINLFSHSYVLCKEAEEKPNASEAIIFIAQNDTSRA